MFTRQEYNQMNAADMNTGNQEASKRPHFSPTEKSLLKANAVGSLPMATPNNHPEKSETSEVDGSSDEGSSQHPPLTLPYGWVKAFNGPDPGPNILREVQEILLQRQLLSGRAAEWKIHDLPLITRATGGHATTTLTSTESISTQTSSNSRITLETRASSVPLSPILADNGGPVHLATQQQPVSDKFLCST